MTPATEADIITTAVLRNALIYAAEEMGIIVRNASFSPNIKERLDHSCALFDAGGRLIAQAEHIPVHLGSLPEGICNTLDYLAAIGERFEPGDMWVLNDPYIAGTHLNDLTLIRPIFLDATGNLPHSSLKKEEPVLVGFAASKAHHTDVGGRVPGSMSGDATELFQEGLILPPLRLMRANIIDESVVRLICANSRTPEARAGDLKAQIAGNLRGELRLLEAVKRYGLAVFRAAVERMLDESERQVRACLAALPPGRYSAEDVLDPQYPGEPPITLRVTLTIGDGTLVVDYTGTDAEVPAPINAVHGVTLAAVYYVLRCVTDPTIPMNEGCFRPVTVHVPEGTVLHPQRPAPVAGGNVETSMRNADVLLRAFAAVVPDRVPASCGGTMTNLMVGGPGWAFYETIGVGMGGRPGMDGIDGIQCNMTNTLNTPIEALERAFPVRVTRYEFREGSAGAGQWRGGCGLERTWELLGDTATVSLLADRVHHAPPGLRGGHPGLPASYTIIRDGQEQPMPARGTATLRHGDTVVLRTPGGGGYGPPERRDPHAVLADVRNGLVTLEEAQAVYRVALRAGDTGLEIDMAATERLRQG
jgi:N-methylhydantoinase B